MEDIKTELKKRGIKSVEVEYALRLSHTSYYKKINGKALFTEEQREALRKLLQVSNEEIQEQIPEVRKIKGPRHPKLTALQETFTRTGLNPFQWAEEHLEISRDCMRRKLSGQWLFTERQKKIIQEALHLPDEEINVLIPKVSNRKRRRRRDDDGSAR